MPKIWDYRAALKLLSLSSIFGGMLLMFSYFYFVRPAYSEINKVLGLRFVEGVVESDVNHDSRHKFTRQELGNIFARDGDRNVLAVSAIGRNHERFLNIRGSALITERH